MNDIQSPKTPRMTRVLVVINDDTGDAAGFLCHDPTKLDGPTPRTQAVEAFWATFVAGHNNGVFIRRLPGNDWRTLGRAGSPLYLHRSDLTQHLSGATTFGVRGGPQTKWGIIDLDLHTGDKDVFLEQLRLLLSAFHSTAGWHFHVGKGGVDLCHVFPAPRRSCGVTGSGGRCVNWT